MYIDSSQPHKGRLAASVAEGFPAVPWFVSPGSPDSVLGFQMQSHHLLKRLESRSAADKFSGAPDSPGFQKTLTQVRNKASLQAGIKAAGLNGRDQNPGDSRLLLFGLAANSAQIPVLEH